MKPPVLCSRQYGSAEPQRTPGFCRGGRQGPSGRPSHAGMCRWRYSPRQTNVLLGLLARDDRPSWCSWQHDYGGWQTLARIRCDRTPLQPRPSSPHRPARQIQESRALGLAQGPEDLVLQFLDDGQQGGVDAGPFRAERQLACAAVAFTHDALDPALLLQSINDPADGGAVVGNQ